jgi:hypothetical protein
MIIRAPSFVARIIARVYRLPGPPLAMAVGGVILSFVRGGIPIRLMLHELVHVTQAAECAPRWLPAWLRPWVGAPVFWWRYAAAHRRYGYAGNPYEVEARRVSGSE